MKMLHTSSSTLILLIILLLFVLSTSSLGEDVILSNVDDFTGFVNNVNKGTTYSGTTVYLGSDLSFSGKAIDPIGINNAYQFCGVFDGQGHIINNLKMNISSSLVYTGLFGYSFGLTIRNVILGYSCSVSSAYSGDSDSSSVFVGGIIGYCYADSEECNIENSVNMADVTFSGKISGEYNLLIGGIVGRLGSSYSSGFNIYVKNCVNYGSVTDSGTVSNYAELGGIVGFSQGSSSLFIYIQNCLNYGAITHNGTSANLYIGGILGNGYSYTYIENCVSAGKISTQAKSNYIGGIVGRVISKMHINYCYYTSDVGVSKSYGAGTPLGTTGTSTSTASVNSDLVSKLNSNATSCNWNKWLLNANNATVTFKMSDDKELSFSSQIILVPNPVKEGNSFLFWCKDTECNEEFDPSPASVSESTALYAKWMPNNYIMTFDFDNGTTVNETFTYNTEIAYPKEEGYTLSWSNYHELMPARDITVTAQWTPNNYTVTLNANGGSVSETSKIVTFNEKYGDLPVPKRDGYAFLGWFTSEINGIEVTNETIFITPYNHTLYAHWEEVTTQVEIVFSTKDLTQGEIEKLLKQYTNADFIITNFEKGDGPDGIRIVIKFIDNEEAKNFVRSIEKSSGMDLIKRIGFIFNDAGSFSTVVYPLSFLSTLFL